MRGEGAAWKGAHPPHPGTPNEAKVDRSVYRGRHRATGVAPYFHHFTEPFSPTTPPLLSAQVLDVACGVGNVLTNKGAICVLLRVRGKIVALINAHLAAHVGKVPLSLARLYIATYQPPAYLIQPLPT